MPDIEIDIGKVDHSDVHRHFAEGLQFHAQKASEAVASSRTEMSILRFLGRMHRTGVTLTAQNLRTGEWPPTVASVPSILGAKRSSPDRPMPLPLRFSAPQSVIGVREAQQETHDDFMLR